MENYYITISRGYGSNGVPISKLVAERLGISFYDDQTLNALGDETLAKALDEFERLDGEDAELAAENVFMMQAALIQSLTQKESFVIMGRAADYILRNLPNVIRVNIHADFEVSVKTVADRDGTSMDEAREKIKKIDAARAVFYEKHTGGAWNDPLNFDITLNSSRIGVENCAELIVKYAEIWNRHHSR